MRTWWSWLKSGAKKDRARLVQALASASTALAPFGQVGNMIAFVGSPDGEIELAGESLGTALREAAKVKKEIDAVLQEIIP